FDAATSLMTDRLRTTSGTNTPGNPAVARLIPLSDPYRTAPYSTFFAHTGNPIVETAAESVFNDQTNANDNMVDWVFVELSNKVSNTHASLTQTRAALLQRDGDIVDIDGVSPVYFKNGDVSNNYVITVKHRNHLGISSNPATALSLGL